MSIYGRCFTNAWLITNEGSQLCCIITAATQWPRLELMKVLLLLAGVLDSKVSDVVALHTTLRQDKQQAQVDADSFTVLLLLQSAKQLNHY